MPDRPYLYYDLTISLCNVCHQRVEAKIIIENDQVFMQKFCPSHKKQKVLISSDAEYYRRCRDYLKPSQTPLKFQKPVQWGCPYDCGLCSDHEQHSCLALIDITDHCNLECPICYADSSPARQQHRTMTEIVAMLDTIVESEGQPDVVQISGGEPTIHPEFWEVLDEAKARPIKHLMVNTNGIRIAREEGFAERLAEYAPNFEVYLQFDSFREEPLRTLRGANLVEVRRQALEKLNQLNLSTTLVVTLQQGLNDQEVGEIVDFAVKQKAVRGVTFQPIQSAGRTEQFDPALHRLTLADVRREIGEQSSVLSVDDLVPVPCHPDCISMAYALKIGDEVIPVSRFLDPESLLNSNANNIIFEKQSDLKDVVNKLFSASASPNQSAESLGELLCCLPKIPQIESLGYENVFRVMVVQFLDAFNFDVRSVKKSCYHFVQPTGEIIPFDTYNLLYRNGKIDEFKKQPVL